LTISFRDDEPPTATTTHHIRRATMILQIDLIDGEERGLASKHYFEPLKLSIKEK
jgi:hypothetical protein